MSVQEIPQMVTDLVDLSKQYVRQETVEPAKALGKAAGYGLLAALLSTIGGLLMSVAFVRVVLGLMGDGPIASAVGYLISMAGLLVVVGVLGWRIKRHVG